MRRLTVPLLLFAVACAFAATILTPDQVIKDRDKLDTKVVTVRGKVEDFDAKTSKRGNAYTVFKVAGAKQKVNGYLRGHLAKAPKNGDTVEVTGVFRKEKKVGEQTFKDEIDATAERGKPHGVKIIAAADAGPGKPARK